MKKAPDILCVGSVLWDVIGRAANHMRVGSDVPGRITRLPGGVAMNIAMTLRRFGMTPALLSAIGRDAEGEELVAEAIRMGLVTDHLYRSDDLPTDVYMAIEGANGLIAVSPTRTRWRPQATKFCAPSPTDALDHWNLRIRGRSPSTVTSPRTSCKPSPPHRFL